MTTKTILGLDLGTTSIGWAVVKESDGDGNVSSIEKIGVRVNPLSIDEQTDFEKGKPISVNANRTLKRGARRNLQRYKQRRENLLDALIKSNIISTETILAEDAKGTTHETYLLRAKAVSEKISKEEFARVLLMINKKRGYKSSRKAKNDDEGQAIDGMAVAKRLYAENITPGQLAFQLLKESKKYLPEFYRSDLLSEFNKVWDFQKQFHPEILTDEFKKEIEGKGQRATSASFWNKFKFNIAENKQKTRVEKKLKAYEWRAKAITEKLEKEEVAFVLTEINNDLNKSSGYLGAISDRSKELYFNKQTVGQYLYAQLVANFHTRLKNQVFYRQDYMDEFEMIWEEQAKYHPELTAELKTEIRDIVIFYQRKLKSQKGLISFCEFESKEIEIEKDGKLIKRTVGLKVSPKSSPLFQQVKIWQILHNIEFRNKITKERVFPDLASKQLLFEELNIKGNLTANKITELLGYKTKDWELNYKEVEGNRTSQALYEAYLQILELEGYDEDLFKIAGKDEIKLADINTSSNEIKNMVKTIFETLGIEVSILDFDAEIDGKAFEKQSSFQLWHLLHSYEGDDSNSGNETLYALLNRKFGFKKEHAQILANIIFASDYGSLSAKAMRKIFPYLKENNYSESCKLAGYNHSSSVTKEENEKRPLKGKLELLKKNSLRSPVVEKILNQMVNVVNAIIEDPSLGKPDEIRIELARELKKNSKERAEMTLNINSAKIENEKIRKLLSQEFGVKNPTRNDIIRYKLYEELKGNGYKDLYTNTYIPQEKLFSKDFDIEHIIPQAKLFDDSFSNKTIVPRQVNLDKGNQTAYDFVLGKYGAAALDEYLLRIEMMFKQKEGSISKAKYQKLLKQGKDIGDGFVERDLRETQYIAKKAKQMLEEVCRKVISTTGNVTDRLREDWGLVNVMQELNFEKYKTIGLTELVEKKDGTFKERIKDWSKRNDHRHHAMDALTIAFTKHSHIQYLNHLNARKDEDNKLHNHIIGIENKETELVIEDNGNKKRRFKQPITNFRLEAKKHLESVLISFKAKNKVVTKNKNKIKSKNGEKVKIELTPRGQLHKETVYGKLQQYVTKEEKVGAKFNEEIIKKVANKKQREALMQRLTEHAGDSKKAFTGKNSLDKNPVYLDEQKLQVVPDKVKLVFMEADFAIRKDITPDLKIDKVIDAGVRAILQKRLDEHNGNAKTAFSDLDKNPIWHNQEKGIRIKKVRISGVKNAEALHSKKDHLGNDILDANGKPNATDFVSTGNNHHVAIYRDAEGNLQEKIVSFYEAVERVNQGLPVIDKKYNESLGWEFLFTMKQNEYFVFPSPSFNPTEIDLLDARNNKLISPHLYRVQKIATKNYFFRHHLETNVDEQKELKNIAYINLQSLPHLSKIVKVRINHLGAIVKVGEY
jgi:CRISPR-associated endonuclease Csn1